MQARLGVKAHTHKSSIKMLTYSESPLYTMLVGQWLLFLNPVLCVQEWIQSQCTSKLVPRDGRGGGWCWVRWTSLTMEHGFR